MTRRLTTITDCYELPPPDRISAYPRPQRGRGHRPGLHRVWRLGALEAGRGLPHRDRQRTRRPNGFLMCGICRELFSVLTLDVWARIFLDGAEPASVSLRTDVRSGER
jgi:hypothetical protein